MNEDEAVNIVAYVLENSGCEYTYLRCLWTKNNMSRIDAIIRRGEEDLSDIVEAISSCSPDELNIMMANCRIPNACELSFTYHYDN